MSINHRYESDSGVIIETLETPHSRLVDSTVLVDLRRAPRYDTQFPGEATLANGNKAYVTITNLSLSGLRFEQAAQQLAHLVPVTSPGDEHRPVTLTLCFAVPGRRGQAGDIRVQCKSVYAHRGPQDVCQVGARFIRFDEGRKALAAYIAYRETGR